ncbi:MAG: SDR family NAD(P)-dependent oxidoreductase, partial [Candidatus Lambdaproteobacteria bacterium]|nr:SDR family NAD(P)-dependent oxidoreductase [Candidatus Lambdaproteobacteria bacterium]
MPRLEHRTAIITGAASGIGRATALLFAAEGARVALVDTNAAGLDETAAAIAAGGGSSHTLVQDVTDGAAAMRAAAELKQTWGTLDALVTSAAVSVDGNVGTVSEEDWDRVFAVNVKGTFLWCKAVLPHMVQARRGSIVTIASQLAFCGGRDNAAYVTSKNAVLGLTRALALDYADQGVRANVLVPGAIET